MVWIQEEGNRKQVFLVLFLHSLPPKLKYIYFYVTSEYIIILPQPFFPLFLSLLPLLSPCFPLAVPLLSPWLSCFPLTFSVLSFFFHFFPFLSPFLPLSFPFLSPFFPLSFPFLSPFVSPFFYLPSNFLSPSSPPPSLNIYRLPLLLLFVEVSISPPPSPLLQVQDDQIYSLNFYH